MLGCARGEVGLFADFVDFQFLKCIPLVGGLKGLLGRVSVVKRLRERFDNPVKESSLTRM